MLKGTRKSLVGMAVAGLLLAACGAGASPTPGELTDVKLQLQWVPQAQFAGEIAASKLGYYAEEGLNVELLTGGPNVANITVGCAPDGPEFTLGWVPKALEAVESGNCDLVSIAQIFQRSGTRSVSWKDSNITKPEDFAGKKVGVWDFGNEHEVIAGARKVGLEVGTDFEKVIQDFNMDALLGRDIDVAEAMTYNEYAQVLEAINPDTGELYTADDLNVIDWNEVGTGMLQDAVFARKAWLEQEGNAEVATKFLKATLRGWIYCRDNPDACVDYVLELGPTLGKGHQAWQMNEVNPLIWPSPAGIGITDQGLWDQTISIAKEGLVLKQDPAEGAFRNDLVQAALDQITEDKVGADFQKGTVEVTEGGN
ncbi:MAG TPA: ABC transporter substrate-binding protein [Candidatus Limnocylindrales bacterium]|jgi:NitT/TauT family transport system substrate-binding protein